MSKLVIVRHGQSQWNLENRFTGFVDIPLTVLGRVEAHLASEKLKNYTFSCAFTSVLSRAIETLDIILQDIGQTNIPIYQNAALNERMYGDLQGLNKGETAEKFGVKQVELWRRSYDTAPPNGESLKDTKERVVPYFETIIAPKLHIGQNILISAHGNSLRALMMYLENIDPKTIATINIPTGIPRLYSFSEDMNITSVRYL